MSWSGKNDGEGPVNITSDLTEIALIRIQAGSANLWVDIRSSDYQLSDFDIAVRSHKDSEAWTIIAAATSDFTTSIQWPLKGCSEDPRIMLSDTWATFNMDVKGLYSVRLRAATLAGSDTDVTAYWSAR